MPVAKGSMAWPFHQKDHFLGNRKPQNLCSFMFQGEHFDEFSTADFWMCHNSCTWLSCTINQIETENYTEVQTVLRLDISGKLVILWHLWHRKPIFKFPSRGDWRSLSDRSKTAHPKYRSIKIINCLPSVPPKDYLWPKNIGYAIARSLNVSSLLFTETIAPQWLQYNGHTSITPVCRLSFRYSN